MDLIKFEFVSTQAQIVTILLYNIAGELWISGSTAYLLQVGMKPIVRDLINS